MRVAHIDERGVGKVVGADFGEPSLCPGPAIGGPGAVGFVRAAQHQHIDHPPPSHFARRGWITRGGPHARMGLLPGPRPDVDVPMRKMLALPAKRTFLVGQGFGNEINGFPKAFNIDDRVGIVRRHLAASRLDEADFQSPSGNDICRGILFRNPHRLLPQRYQGSQAQDAGFAGLAGQDTQKQWVGS